jgi:hypothetical protein
MKEDMGSPKRISSSNEGRFCAKTCSKVNVNEALILSPCEQQQQQHRTSDASAESYVDEQLSPPQVQKRLGRGLHCQDFGGQAAGG